MRINFVIMITQSKRIVIVIVSMFLLFYVVLNSYTNSFGKNKHPLERSVFNKFKKRQPSKEVHDFNNQNQRKTKKIPNKKIIHKNMVSSGVNKKLKGHSVTKLTRVDTKAKLHYLTKKQRRIVTNRPEKHIKRDSDNCTKKEVKLSHSALPTTGLVSFPGSGNTWTRHLIQQMTGLGTSSVYCDGSLRKKGFPYECQHDKSKTVVVKTHELHHLKMFAKIVLLLRNPYDALLSYANYVKAGHTGHPPKYVLIKAINKGFNHSLNWYVNLTRNTIKTFKGPVHIVQYETLQTNMAHELRKLTSFFNLNVTNKDIECTVKLQEGNFHRLTNKKIHLELLRTVYSNEQLLRLQEATRYTEKMIKNAYNIDIDLGGRIEKVLLHSL